MYLSTNILLFLGLVQIGFVFGLPMSAAINGGVKPQTGSQRQIPSLAEEHFEYKNPMSQTELSKANREYGAKLSRNIDSFNPTLAGKVLQVDRNLRQAARAPESNDLGRAVRDSRNIISALPQDVQSEAIRVLNTRLDAWGYPKSEYPELYEPGVAPKE